MPDITDCPTCGTSMFKGKIRLKTKERAPRQEYDETTYYVCPECKTTYLEDDWNQ